MGCPTPLTHWDWIPQRVTRILDAAKAQFGQSTFYPRLRNNIRTLRAAHQYIFRQATPGPTPEQATYLHHVARDTWRLFERVVDASNQFPLQREAAATLHPWWQTNLAATLASARRDAQALSGGEAPATALRLHALAQRLETLAWEASFTFLYHPQRHLLHIGYRVDDQVLDTAYYDLLASESRMTSLLAIAKGDVPVAHWAALGRPYFAVGNLAGLRSWSGSMFEYLMPSLVLREPDGSALREAGKAAVREHIAFLASQGLP